MFSHLIAGESKEPDAGCYTAQSYGNSCAAFSCSVLFCALLKNAGYTVSKKMQFIFEAYIYQAIWTAPGEKADEKSCFAFLQPFIKKPIESYLLSDAAKIEQIKPNTAEILFCKKADYHAVFACSVIENTQPTFLLIAEQSAKQIQLPQEITQVLQIPLIDFNVKMIKSWGEMAERKVIEFIFKYPEAFLQPFQKTKMVCEYFPEYKKKFAKCILAAHNKMIYGLADIEEFCEYFPEQREEAAQLVIYHAKKFLGDANKIIKFLSDFADFTAFPTAIAKHLVCEKEIDRLIAVCEKLADAPEMRDKILQYALKSYSLDARSKYFIRNTFPDYKEKQGVCFFARLRKKNSSDQHERNLRSLFSCGRGAGSV